MAEFDQTGCYCPGEQVSIQCVTSGAGSTRYNVTGCTFDDLNLLHTGFQDQTSYRECTATNGLHITAQSISNVSNTFTSQLNFTVIPDIDVTVQCYHDFGSNRTLVGKVNLKAGKKPLELIIIK